MKTLPIFRIKNINNNGIIMLGQLHLTTVELSWQVDLMMEQSSCGISNHKLK